MLGKKRQRKYAVKRCKAIINHLGAFAISQNQEELHKIRVEIKKMEAMAKMLQYCSIKQNMPEYNKPFKEIFKQAGIIRDAQMHLQLAKRYDIGDKSFENTFDNIKMNGLKTFHSNIYNFQKKVNQIQQKLQKNFYPVKNRCIRQMYQKKLQKLADAFDKRADLHACRKKIKTLLYVYDLLPQKLSSTLHIDQPYLDKLQDLIGKWHDTIIEAQLFPGTPENRQAVNILQEQSRKQLNHIHLLSKVFLRTARAG